MEAHHTDSVCGLQLDFFAVWMMACTGRMPAL
jgi:hypothetical protein